MSVKPFSYDDAIYHEALKNNKSRKDKLIMSFNNLEKREKAIYLAVTTEYIDMIDEDGYCCTFKLSRLIKARSPGENFLCLDYLSGEERERMTLKVLEFGPQAREILDSLQNHLKVLTLM